MCRLKFIAAALAVAIGLCQSPAQAQGSCPAIGPGGPPLEAVAAPNADPNWQKDPKADLGFFVPNPPAYVAPDSLWPPSDPEAVMWWQGELNAKQNAGLAVDGNYGVATKNATRAFQAAHGLDQDGEAGPLTVAAMKGLG